MKNYHYFAILLAVSHFIVEIGGFRTSPRSAILGIQSSRFRCRASLNNKMKEVESKDSVEVFEVKDRNLIQNLAQSVTAVLPMISILLLSDPAFADGNSYGILAGRTASLLHPVTNLALFGTSLYSAYLGLQWRRLRDLGEELKSLNNELPTLLTTTAKFPLSEKLAELTKELSALSQKKEEGKEEEEGKRLEESLRRDIAALTAVQDLDTKYLQLTTTRKSLLTANLRDKHHLTGSILLGVGVTVSLLGAFNTYMRAGRLFPGPHLFAGMAIVILWAVASSLVPAMQKGNATARLAHIALNTINIALFAWQIPTGWEITLKVLEKTSWP